MEENSHHLKWLHHRNYMSLQFDKLREEENLIDFTFVCEGKQLSAHKLVLSACSPLFKELLQTNPCKHPIFFADIKYSIMQAILEYIYQGETQITNEDLRDFIKIAGNFQIRGLTQNDDSARELEESERAYQARRRINESLAKTKVSVSRVKAPASSAAAAAPSAPASNLPNLPPLACLMDSYSLDQDDSCEYTCPPVKAELMIDSDVEECFPDGGPPMQPAPANNGTLRYSEQPGPSGDVWRKGGKRSQPPGDEQGGGGGNGGEPGKKKYKQRRYWRPDEEQIVIEVWRNFVSELKSSKRNAHVYEAMNRELGERGLFIDMEELTNKIKNLSKKYRSELKKIDLIGKVEWPLFDAVHSVIGNYINNESFGTEGNLEGYTEEDDDDFE